MKMYLLFSLVLLLLLHQAAGVGETMCYSCSDCATVNSYTDYRICKTSCETVVSCYDDKPPLVSRTCSMGNEDSSCSLDLTNSNTYLCYCNQDFCDPLIGRNLCNGACNILGSISLILAAAISLIHLGQ